MNLDHFGFRWDKPVTRMVRVINLLRRFWLGETINYNDEFFSFKDAKLQIQPTQKPYPPIYLGANSPRTRKLVGEIADGWIATETLKLVREDLKEGLKKSGKSLDEIDRVLFTYTAIDEDFEKAFMVVEKWVKPLAVSFGDKLKQLYGLSVPEEFSIHKILTTQEYLQKLLDFSGRIPKDIVKQITLEFNILGDVEACIKQIEEFIKAGITHFAVINVGPDTNYVFKVYGKEIIPYFKENFKDG